MTTATKEALSRLGALILIWLLTQRGERGTRSGIERALKGILEHRWSAAEQRRVLDEEMPILEQSGNIERGARGSVALTESGRRAGLVALGIEALPPKADWKIIKRKYLLARAIGLSPPSTPAAAKRFEAPSGMRAAILAHHYRLDVGEYPTLNQVSDALVWEQLGVKTREPLTLSAIKKLLLNKALGSARPQAPEKIVEQLTARAVKARRTDLAELQAAVLRRLLDDPEPSPGVEAPGDQAPAQAADEKVTMPDNEVDFASRVLAAARASKTGRFGHNKVFISHVFRKLADEGAIAESSEAFKARLVDAHLRGLLSLSRADLVDAMKPEDVSASEAQKGGSTFHFVRV
jgi:hypothetical protein